MQGGAAVIRESNVDLRQVIACVVVRCPRAISNVVELPADNTEVIAIAIGFPSTPPVGIIAILDDFKQFCVLVNHTRHIPQNTTATPSVTPFTIVAKIADLVRRQPFAIIGGQQIAPLTIPVAIGNGVQCRAQRARGVGILRLAEDIAAVVVGVDPRLARRLIVLAGQLVEAVVDVAGGVGAVGYRCNIAPCIVGVGIGRAAGRPLVNLRAGGGRSGILVRDAGADNSAAAILGGNAGHAAVDIVGIVGALAACCRLLQPVVVVVGVVGGVAGAVQRLGLRGQVVLVVIAPLYGIAVIDTPFLITH